ncbi:MAG: hypothetical protein KAH32_07090, partial [Chlamydiia bacterium]|nr:hypothetical protein [Chlamydiia bacterium]
AFFLKKIDILATVITASIVVILYIEAVVAISSYMRNATINRHAKTMARDLQNALANGKDIIIHDIKHPKKIDTVINSLKSFRSIRRKGSLRGTFLINMPMDGPLHRTPPRSELLKSRSNTTERLTYLCMIASELLIQRHNSNSLDRTLLNDKVLEHCNDPAEMLIYQCMVVSDLLMQQHNAIRHRSDEDKYQNEFWQDREEAFERDIYHVSNSMINTLKKYKSQIKDSAKTLRENSYRALLDIKESYEAQGDSIIDTDTEYSEEFLRNLNVILYMASKENFDNIDRNFIGRVKDQISTYCPDEENKMTKLESRAWFLKSFKEITK